MTRARHPGALLEEFVGQRRYVPEGARIVESWDDLPLRLQARARDADADAHWRAWTDGHRVWFIHARLVNVPSQQLDELALDMSFYDRDDLRAGRGIWLRRVTGDWALYCVLGEDRATTRDRAASYRRLPLAS